MHEIPVSVLFLTCHVCLATEKYTDTDILFSNLFADYNKNLLPQKKPNPVVVNSSFALMGIREFDEVSGKFSIMGCFVFRWHDFRLKWNTSVYGGIPGLVIPESNIWRPNPTLLNPYDDLKLFSSGIFPVSIGHNGIITWAPGGIMSTVCNVDVRYYPFDVQVCNLEFMCWGYSKWIVLLNAPFSHVSLDYFSEHGEWELVKASMSSKFHLNVISVDITIKRRPGFVILNFILPVFFMIVLNLLVFILPVESGERVSYSITVLLAIAVFLTLVAENLPKTSLQTAVLSYFLLSYLIISSLTCAFVIISSSIYYADEEKTIFSFFVRVAKRCCLQRTLKYKTNENNGEHLLDTHSTEVSFRTISRWFDFIVFNLCLLSIIASIVLFFLVFNKTVN